MQPYVYVIVRTDMTLAQQLVQVGHAALECGMYYAAKPDNPHFLIVLAARSESELRAFHGILPAAGIAVRLVEEPDMDNQATALVTEPLAGERRHRMSAFPLWKPPHEGIAHSDAGAPHAPPVGATPTPLATHAPVAQLQST